MNFIDIIVEKTETIKFPYRIAILVGTIFLVAGFFVYFFYLPNAKKIEQLNRDITTLEKRIRRAKALAKRLPEFEKKAKEIDKQFKLALKLLPNKKEIPALLEQINHIGIDSGLIFRLFKPSREIPKGFYNEIPISIEVEGRFHNIMTFIYRITTMQRIVNVFNIHMKPIKRLSPELKATFTAVTNRYAPERAVRKGRRRRR